MIVEMPLRAETHSTERASARRARLAFRCCGRKRGERRELWCVATAARLGWAVDEALMCRNECTGGTSGLASMRGSGGTRAGRGGGRG